MAKNLTQKILEAHLIEGQLNPGEEIAIKIDHTLLQDATGTVAMMEFEALGLDSVRVELAAQYVDHNILQADSKNADHHKYLQTACARAGDGIRARFAGGFSRGLGDGRYGCPRGDLVQLGRLRTEIHGFPVGGPGPGRGGGR